MAGIDRLRDQESAGEIDRQDRLPFRQRHLLQRLAGLAADAARAMHKNVDWPEVRAHSPCTAAASVTSRGAVSSLS